MDTRKNFLEAVVGQDGAQALAKATSLGPDVEWAVLPRAVLSWLTAEADDGYQELVPGTKTHLNLVKKETGYTGSVSMPDGSCLAFVDQSLTSVAAHIVLSVGGLDPAPPLTSPSLARLGKSIDLLVRSRALRKIAARQKTQGEAGGVGAAAGPMAPKPPTPPDPTAPPTNQKRKTKPTGPLKVTKAEAHTDCNVCGGQRFKNNVFCGCACFSDLSKNTTTILTPDGDYILQLGKSWDEDAILVLLESYRQ